MLAAGLCACVAQAQEVPPPAYQLAAQRAGIPSTVLYAVALQESGIRRNGRIVPWPWSLNVAGQSRRYATRADACAGLQQAMRSTPHTRIDAGLGQINLGYHQQRYASACDLLDPYRNLAIAAEILREQHAPARTGCWRWAATTARGWRARRPLPAQRVAPPRPGAGRTPNRRGSRRTQGDIPMTTSHLALRGLLVLLAGLPLASLAGEPLIVVEDRGGASALPYYEALNLQPRTNAPARPPIPTPQVPATPADEAAMLPVRSAKLTPAPSAACHRGSGSAAFRCRRRRRGISGLAAQPGSRAASAARSVWWSTSRPCRAWRGCAPWCPAYPSRPCPATTWPSAWACGTTRC